MTKARFISELAQGGRVDGTYLLRAKELRIARTGDAYLALVLADRTGSMPAVLFRPSRLAVEIPGSAVVRVQGTVAAYRGTRRVMVEHIDPAESWNAEDLLASAVRPRVELEAEFTALVRSVSDPGLRKLLRLIFGDREYFDRFVSCPASRSDHRARLGGLVEHTIAVSSTCLDLSRRYGEVNGDLLVTAALLHDTGMVDALSFDTGIRETDEGRLIGHAALGASRVRTAAQRSRLPRTVLVHLEHAILSHHETSSSTGSRPMTIEALMLQHADGLDAHVAGFSEALQGAVCADEHWTDERNPFCRSLYAGASQSADATVGEPGVREITRASA